jgi:hypothetical protein
MIQTLNHTYYTVTKYKGSDIILPSTYCTAYSLGEIIQSNYQTINNWLEVCKENCKRFTKVPLQKKVKQQPTSEILIKKERRKTYLANDRIAYFNTINHPNYNPFSPLFEAETKPKPRSNTMADETERTRFLKAMNGNFDEPTKLPQPPIIPHDDANQLELPSPSNIHHEHVNQKDSSPAMDSMTTPTQDTNQVVPTKEGATSGKHNTTNNEDLLELASKIYAPRQLTWETDPRSNPRAYDKHERDETHNFALVIRIGQKKNHKLKFNEARIMTAILTSFQKVSPTIKIVPINTQQPVISDIESPTQIICDEAFYSQYIEEPTITQHNTYICRIHFSAKKPFFWFKKNIHLQKWLSQETIRLEENNITAIHCPKVGFLTQCHPRASLLKVYETRIKQKFGKGKCPEFYCTIEHISVRQTTTKVIVIRSAEKDVKELLDLFKIAKTINFQIFIPWREWNAMISAKQLDLIQKQNKNITNSKSIIISGFKDNGKIKFNYSLVESDNMIYTNDDDNINNDNTNDKRNVTVDEFLYNHYKDCDGHGLFEYIYPVVLGVREILVQHRHVQEVIELGKVIKEDMFLHMSIDAADEIFENLDQIENKAINHSKWVPFLTPNNYKEAEEHPMEKTVESARKQYKRSNNSEYSNPSKMSYARAANPTMKQPSSTSAQPEPNLSQRITNPNAHHTTEEMKLVQAQLLELKTTQQELDKQQKMFEAKQEKSNNHMLTEIKRTNEYINQNVMETMEKTSHDISNIQKEMFTLKDLNSNVNAVLQFVNQYVRNDVQNKQALSTMDNNMMIDKDGYKRNHNGNLRDDDGNVQSFGDDKENNSTGGNQNKCNFYETDSFGNYRP